MVSINQVRKKEPGARTGAGITGNRMIFYDKAGSSLSGKKGFSFTRGLIEEFREIQDWANGNRVRLIDSMVYASTALAAAAWVAADTAATTGVTVTRDTSDYLNADSSVKFLVGSAFAAAVDATKTLSPSISSYPEDRFSHNGSYQNWTPYNYIIIPIHAGAATAATDIDVVVTDFMGVESVYNFPAITTNYADIWNPISIALGDFTDGTNFKWDSVASLTLRFNGVTMGNDEFCQIGEIVLCKYSNGFTPAFGPMVPVELMSDSMVEGMQAKLSTASGVQLRVTAGGDGDEEVIGILCGAGDTGDIVMMQVGGVFVGELGALTSLEVGDYCAGAASGGLKWTESAATGADAIAKYIGPFQDSAAQYTYAWFTLNTGGGLPS